MKKLLAILLCIILIGTYIPSVFATDRNIGVTMTTGKTGNIFFGGEVGEFKFRFINSKYEDYNIRALFSAVGSKGNIVFSKIEEFTLISLNYATRKIFIDFDKDIKFYDVYKMKVELLDENKGLYEKVEFDFSFVRNNEGYENNDAFGINTHYGSYDKNLQTITNTMPLLEKTGASIIRDCISWSRFESEKGVYAEVSDFPFISEAKKHELDLLMTLAYGNKLYTPQTMSIPVNETEITAFSAYAENIASKIKGITNYFELWNEPNASNFNEGNASEADYSNLSKAVYSALENANEDAILMGMATTSSDTNWMQKVHNSGGTAYMDNISFHPYRWYGYPGDYDFIPRLQKVDDFLTENGLNKKMWLTELGWSSGVYDGQTEAYSTEHEKAMYLVHSYVMSRQFDNIEKYFWYNFICKGTNEAGFDDNFGMIANANDEVPFSAREAYLAATNMNIILADSEFSHYEEPVDGTYIYKFNRKSDGSKVYVMWTVNGTDNVSIDVEDNKVIEYDLFGNKQEHRIFDGKFETDITIEPVYLEIKSDEFTDIKYNENVIEISGVVPMRKAERDVSMIVLKPVKSLSDVYLYSKDSVAYMDDVKTDENGEYSFKFMISDEHRDYYAYILFEEFDNYMIIPLNPGREIESQIKIEVDGEIVENISDFSSGKNVTISYELENRSLENVEARVIVGFYKNNMLVGADMKDVLIRGDNTLIGDTETVVPYLDFDSVCVYVWNKNTLKPYMENIKFNK